jgi:hypothetical protein
MLDGTTASADLLTTLARQHTARCVSRLAEILNGDDQAAAVAAARELLDRGYGRPLQPLAFDTTTGITVEVTTGAEAEQPHSANGEGHASWNAG